MRKKIAHRRAQSQFINKSSDPVFAIESNGFDLAQNKPINHDLNINPDKLERTRDEIDYERLEFIRRIAMENQSLSDYQKKLVNVGGSLKVYTSMVSDGVLETGEDKLKDKNG